MDPHQRVDLGEGLVVFMDKTFNLILSQRDRIISLNPKQSINLVKWIEDLVEE